MECFELLNRIKSGNVPSAVALVGADAYWKRTALEAITSLADPFDLTIIDEGVSLKDVVIDLGTIPLLGAFRVIILRGFAKPSDKDKKAVQDYLKAPNQTSLLVFDCKCDFKEVEVVSCEKQSGETVTKETEKLISVGGKRASLDVIRTLVDYCESDMSKIQTEVMKLCAYSDGDITLDDVNVCVEPSLTYKTYNLIKYILAGDYVSCYDLIKKNDEKTTSVLASVINLFRCALYLKGRVDENTLARVFDMKPYQIKFAKNVVWKYAASDLYFLLQLFYRLEFEIKSGVTTDENALMLAISEAIERRIK